MNWYKKAENIEMTPILKKLYDEAIAKPEHERKLYEKLLIERIENKTISNPKEQLPAKLKSFYDEALNKPEHERKPYEKILLRRFKI